MSLRALVSAYYAITGVFITLAVQDEDLDVQCGMENMQVVIPRHIKLDAKLKVLRKFHLITNCCVVYFIV